MTISVADRREFSVVVGVTVGNTRTRVGLLRDGTVQEGESVPTSDPKAVAALVASKRSAASAGPVVMASVNGPAADAIEQELRASHAIEPFRIGRDLTIPMRHALDDASTVGQDRLLTALGAFSKSKQACVVVDAGTAITVDFVDGQGTFQGGVIAPGLHMMLASMHAGTAALPQLKFENPDPARGPFGKDTKHAMQLGVRCAAIGLVRYVVERYAEHYEAYPQVVATGGDAPALFEHDEVVEHLVPDLQLLGIAEVCRAAVESGESDGDEE